MKKKQAMTDVTTETNIHVSLKIPLMVDLEAHYSKKTTSLGLMFFDNKKDIALKAMEKIEEPPVFLTTKF